MSAIEDKVRRRLAPFVVEGKIGAPQFSSNGAPETSPLTVNVRVTSTNVRAGEVESALRAAFNDLVGEAQLVISAA